MAETNEHPSMVARGDESLVSRQLLFEARRDAVRAEMDRLQRTLEVLEYKCWYYATAEAAGTEDAVRDIPESAVPERLRAGFEILKG